MHNTMDFEENEDIRLSLFFFGENVYVCDQPNVFW